MKTHWIIEYWKKETKTVKCFSAKDGSWEEAPAEDVIFVYVQRKGVRPYGNPETLYTQILRGADYYFYYEKEDGSVVFGSWNDGNRESVINVWHPDGRIESKPTFGRPKDIPDKIVKNGVWVDEPWAKRIGLTLNFLERRTIKGCCDKG